MITRDDADVLGEVLSEAGCSEASMMERWAERVRKGQDPSDAGSAVREERAQEEGQRHG